MQYRASSYPSWSRSFRVASLAVALAAAFFVVWGATAHAQQPGQRPDFKITQAQFDGRNLHVEYINATGIGYPARRYEVGFQWYDATNRTLGTRRWFPVPAVERGGVSIFDTKYRIELSYKRNDGRISGEQLRRFIEQRPDKAVELRITVDDGDRIAEDDERNNIASLKFPPPDLQITAAGFTAANRVQMKWRNANAAVINGSFRIGFTWVDDAGATAAATRWVNVLEPVAGTEVMVDSNRLDVSYLTESGRQANDRLDWYLERRPARATQLRITMDDAGTVTEANEQNNVMLLRSALPDLVVRDAKFMNGQLVFTYGNGGDGYIRDSASRVLFQWRNAVGQPVGSPRWYRFAQMDPRQMFTVNAERFDVEYAVPGTNRTTTQRLGSYVREQPQGAERLDITMDDEARILETNETNNTETVMPALPPKPDLTIETITIDKDGQPHATVWNRGAGVASSVVVAYEYRDRAGKRLDRGSGSRETAPLGLGPDQKIIAALLGPILDTAVTVAVTVDPKNAVAETDEQNNAKEGPAPMADLAIAEAKIAGSTLSLTYRNAGNRKADPVSIWLHFADAQGAQIGLLYWMDVSPIRAGGTQVLANETMSAMSSASPVELQNLFAAPPTGATHLKVLLDGPDRVVESNERNNVVVLPVPVRPKPNLQLIGIDALPNDIILVRTLNRGKGKIAGFQWELQWEDAKGALLGTPVREDGIALASGNSYNISVDAKDTGSGSRFDAFFGKPPAGATRVRATVDPENAIPESDETNNRKIFDGWKPPEPPKQPDLTFTNIFLVPPKYERLVIGFQNAGKAATPEFPWMMVWIDAAGKRVGTPYEGVVPSLKPNWRFGAGSDLKESDPNGKPMSRGKWLSQPKPDGAVKLEIVIDPENVIAESDETNNRQMFAEWVPPKPAEPEKTAQPDLMLRDATLADGKLKVTIVNTSKGSAERVMWQFTWLGAQGEALATSEVEAAVGTLKSGASYPVELPYANARPVGIFRFLQNMPDGAAALAIVVDPKNTIAESDETNNTARIALPGADLAFGVPMVRGDALIIPVVNHGTTASVPTDMWLQWYGKGKWLPGSGAVDVPAVGGSAMVEVRVPLNRSFGPDGKLLTDIPPTAERLRLFVDGLRKVQERNEQNNLLMMDRAVFPTAAEPVKPGKPDLVPEGLKVGPASPTEGATLDFSAVVRNKGTGKAGASVAWFIVDFDRDDEPDVSPEPDDVKALAPNSLQPVVWEDAVEAQAGTHAVEFCVDVEEVVDESNEDNNCVSRTFTVGSGPMAIGPFRSILGAILSGLATPIVAGERP